MITAASMTKKAIEMFSAPSGYPIVPVPERRRPDYRRAGREWRSGDNDYPAALFGCLLCSFPGGGLRAFCRLEYFLPQLLA